tara:strand:- start:31248 stop:34037 length:2790 start_codon:yes stop_codon:yes gene_type:complete
MRSAQHGRFVLRFQLSEHRDFFFEPLTHWLRPKLQEASDIISSCASIAEKNNVLFEFTNHVVKQCGAICGYALYVDYRCSASENTGVELENWSSALNSHGWSTVFSKYPVLERLLNYKADALVKNLSLICNRLDNDSKLLASKLDFSGKITDIQFGLSDPHRGAQTVAKISSKKGSVIYKPKPLCNEVLFYEVIQNSFADRKHYFNIPQLVDRSNYGWMEFFAPPTQKIQAPNLEARSFAAALCYYFSATDLHYQNVGIVDGKLFFFDLETLFLPMDRRHDIAPLEPWRFADILKSDLFRRQLGQGSHDPSGYSPGKIESPYPKLLFVVGGNGGVTPSAIKPIDNSIMDEKLPDGKKLASFISSDLETIRNRFPMDRIQSRIRSGELQSRFILRSTENYYRLQQWLFQPVHLSCEAIFASAKTKIVANLSDGFFEADFSKVTQEECDQLAIGDIPLFTCNPNDTSLRSGSALVARDFFRHSGGRIAEAKWRSGGPADSKFQAELVSAVHELDIAADEDNTHDISAENESEELASFVDQISSQILNAGIQTRQHGKFWVGHISDTSGRNFVPSPYLRDYYSGSLGVTVFLEAAAKILADKQHKRVCDLEETNAAQILALHSFRSPSEKQSLGMGGVAGKLHALAILGMLSAKKWSAASQIIKQELDTITSEQMARLPNQDFMQGAAGLLTVVSFLRHHDVCEVSDDLLAGLAERVRKSIKDQLEADRMHGLAHGLSGSILALAQSDTVCDVTKQSELIDLVDRYLKNIFDDISQHGFMTDARVLNKPTPINRSWCHGITGVSLVLSFLQKVDSLADQLSGHQITFHKIFSYYPSDDRHGVDSYCCGEAGEIDQLITRGNLLGRENDYNLARRRFMNIQNDWIKNQRFQSFLGQSSASLFPGLFQGAAGIGYTGLRLMDPTLPSLTAMIES